MQQWWSSLNMGARLAVVTGSGLGVAAIAAVAILVMGGTEAASPPPVTVATSVPTSTATVEATRPPLQHPTDVPRATPTATDREPVGQVAQSLQRLIADYGYPDAADFGMLRIPVLGMDARVSTKYVDPGAAMPDPVGPAHVVWYDMEAYRGMGGEPGSGGNSIFSAHVDYNAFVGYAGVQYRGEGIFYNLGKLRYGDLIEVEHEGETHRYRVLWVRNYSADPSVTDWGEIWRGTPGLDEITLYTCGGDFDWNTREYDDRVVVRAVRF